MGLRRLTTTKHTLLYPPVTRFLNHVTSTFLHRHTLHPDYTLRLPFPPPSQPPQASNLDLTKWVSSILCRPSLDYSQYEKIVPHLTPHEFGRYFVSIGSNLDPKTVLNFFYFWSQRCGFRFTVKSYCILVRLLVKRDLLSPVRLLLIRLIERKAPVSSRGMHLEIASAFGELCSGFKPVVGDRVVDMFVHVCCTQFRHLGFGFGFDVFSSLVNKGVFPSSKTCNFLLSWLVKVTELEKCYALFDVICHGGINPDVCVCV